MISRHVDSIRGETAGPTLIIVGGLHGNEPAGVEGARRALAAARRARISLRGEVVAFAGNTRALALGRRYLMRDLNRQWTNERIAAARSPNASARGLGIDAEAEELAELADAIDGAMRRARGPIYALDLHTTSAAGAPFGVVGSTREHRAFAARFPITGILGLEATLEGVLTRYLTAKGCVTLAVEGGQNESPDAAANHQAVVTIALAAAGLAGEDAIPEIEAARARLLRARGDLPHLIEVVSRHAIHPDHAFVMEPGFANIQRTAAGTLLARHRAGEIRAPFDGLVLLPLYQAQGTDGFFYGREVNEERG